jgi:putative Mn2+ efflux pump MntP
MLFFFHFPGSSLFDIMTLLIGSALLSIFHALIPSHWLPILAVSRNSGWSLLKTLRITLLIGLAHVLSTVAVGFVIAGAGVAVAETVSGFTKWVAPVILGITGLFYVYQHYYHHHFHLHKTESRWGIVATLAISMFFSPCLEVEAYFLAAGPYGWGFVAQIAFVYALTSVAGMLIWMWLAFHGLRRMDWHALEHNAGLITGIVLILSGLLMWVWE